MKLPAGVIRSFKDIQLNFEKIASSMPTFSDASGKVVRGNVSDTGTVTAGTGFSVVKGATGAYTITFDPAFKGPPSVMAMGDAASIPLTITQDGIATGSQLALRIRNADTNVAIDEAFSFIAIGPA